MGAGRSRSRQETSSPSALPRFTNSATMRGMQPRAKTPCPCPGTVMRREAGRVAAARSAQRGRGDRVGLAGEQERRDLHARRLVERRVERRARPLCAQAAEGLPGAVAEERGCRAGGRIGEEGDVLRAEHRELKRAGHAGLDVGDRQDALGGERGEVALPGLAEERGEEGGGLRRVEEGERHLPERVAVHREVDRLAGDRVAGPDLLRLPVEADDEVPEVLLEVGVALPAGRLVGAAGEEAR